MAPSRTGSTPTAYAGGCTTYLVYGVAALVIGFFSTLEGPSSVAGVFVLAGLILVALGLHNLLSNVDRFFRSRLG